MKYSRTLSLYALSFLFLSCFADWTEYKVLTTVRNVVTDPKDIYIDEDNNINLIYYHGNTDITFAKLNTSLDVMYEYNFTMYPWFYNIFHCQMKGLGPHRIATFDVNFKNYTRDVYYSESFDSGNTWTSLVQIPRDDTRQRIHRGRSNIVYIKETGRIYIFYLITKEYEMAMLGMVTRPSNSKVFREEEQFQKGSYYFALSAVYTHNATNRETVLHLFVGSLNKTNELVMTQSKDSGIRWTPFKRIDGFKENQNMIAAAMNCSIGFVYGTQSIWLKYSNDCGETWSIRKEIKASGGFSPQGLKYYAATFSHIDNVPKYLYYFVRDTGYTIKFGRLNLTSSTLEELDNPPFTHLSWQSSGIAYRKIDGKDYFVGVTGQWDYNINLGKILISSYKENQRESSCLLE